MPTFKDELLNTQLPSETPVSGVVIDSGIKSGYSGYLIENWITAPLNPLNDTDTPINNDSDADLALADKLLRLTNKLKTYFQ